MAVKMRNLKKWEKVDIVIRRHWIAFVFLWVYFFSGLVLSAIVFALFGVNAPILLLMSVFWMFYAMFLYINWINYELDLFVFTNNRVLCIEQKSFLNRRVGETTLDKVQEISISTQWLLANLFDFGTMVIMTAGASPNFDMTYSPRPMENQRYINNLVDRYRDNLYGGANKDKEGKSTTKEKVDSVLKAGI